MKKIKQIILSFINTEKILIIYSLLILFQIFSGISYILNNQILLGIATLTTGFWIGLYTLSLRDNNKKKYLIAQLNEQYSKKEIEYRVAQEGIKRLMKVVKTVDSQTLLENGIIIEEDLNPKSIN
jgi:hypothetical protein